MPVRQSFTIAKAAQTIAFDPLGERTLADPPFALNAAASSGLSVGFAASGDCTVSGVTAAITRAGSCTIVASQGGDDNYHPAPSVSRSFTIRKGSQVITFNLGLTAKYREEVDFTVSAQGGASGNPVTFSSATPAVCTLSGTAVHIVDAGTCTLRATQAGNADYDPAPAVERSFSVLYRFTGFFQPVDNPAVLNRAKAGSAVPVKFSLGGDQGLSIFMSGLAPTVAATSCATGTTIDEIEQTVTASASGLTYDPAAAQYSYVWKTQSGWANSCRKFVMTLKDGTRREALFQFK
jgi:hypothetical protein